MNPSTHPSPLHAEESAPLSSAQQRLWFLDQLYPGNPAYNISEAWRLSGPLHRMALEESLQALIKRHGALRTRFAGSLPIQIVAPTVTLEVPLVDLQALAPTEREDEARRLGHIEARQPFDLAVGPLFRVQLIRFSPEDHLLLWTIHHIVSDGWSMGLLIRELVAGYTAFIQGEPLLLPPLPITYTDFARRPPSQRLQQALDYWQQQLAGAPTVLDLLTDYPRPPVQTFDGATHVFFLPKALTTALKALAQTSGATLVMALLAVIKVLLHRYTGQEDILVGSPTAQRNQVELEPLVGFFVNMLVLRTDLGEQPTFRQVLQRVCKTALEALDHQDIPFEQLVEHLQPERVLSHTPLFQVVFAPQVPEADLKAPGLTIKPLRFDTGNAIFDLTFSIVELFTGDVRVELEYNTALFTQATIERLAGHLSTLIQSALDHPDQPIHALTLLPAPERAALLALGQGPQTDYPRDATIHQLFEAQVLRAPEAIALVFGTQQHSYGALDHQANHLARHLQALGVTPATPVGLCVTRSPQMIIALLGILKAGAAYVPLDPQFPPERLSFMVTDAAVTLVLTVRPLQALVPETVPQVLLDEPWPRYPDAVHDSGQTGCSLAYILYTSGSTGKPKGVLTPHRAVVRLVCQTDYADFSAQQVFLQLAPLAFDASTFEIWGALLNGARLVLMPAATPSLEELAQALQTYAITTLWLTAGLFHLMVDAQLAALSAVAQVLAGGDVLSVGHVRRLLEQPGERVLINGYGPTESTTFACCHRMRSFKEMPGSVPIGRPIANTQVYILDGYQQPVPAGIAGELYVGGAGLALGYLNQEQLSAQQFISSPVVGARLYKTGDRVRYLGDGTIEFLGRWDAQVKIRGYRIEIGEVESVLHSHPQVRIAVVLVREDQPRSKRLVSYIVPEGGTVLTSHTLRQYLSTRLPEFMIPAAFVTLAHIPLTPNGKVDRKALPAPDQDRTDQPEPYIAPRTPVEKILVDIWSEILKRTQVGIQDNFFHLGGHSLLATQVISRVREIFSLDLPLHQFFTRPTVADLAQYVGGLRAQGQTTAVLPVVSVVGDRALPLSSCQQRLWLLDQLQAGSAAYNVPVTIHLHGILDEAALHASLNEIIRRHEILRTTFIVFDEQPRQVIAPRLMLELPVLDLQALSQVQVTKMEAQQPFDLTRGPLLRAKLFRLAPTEQVLMLTMHHIVSDGWSIGVLIQELSALYAAYSQGQPSGLAPLTIQYADFAHWQQQWLRSAAFETQFAYWQAQLAGAPTALDLPTDYPRPPVQSYRGAAHRFLVPQMLAQGLKTLSQHEGATLFMTLLAVFKVLLYRYTSQEDLVVGSPIANRNRAELEPLIGFFVNTLVLRTDLSGEPTFREMLRRVRTMTLDAYDHQDLPFEKLVEHLQPERAMSYTPLFQVMFVLQNAPLSSCVTGGLTLIPGEIANETAKFDLTLEMVETAQGMTAVLEYSTDLFERATLERMAGHWLTLAAAVVADPDQPISTLPLLTCAEREQLLIHWNETRQDFPQDRCIHAYFEQQVERTPEAIALVWGEQSLTYRQLNEQANQLAHHLQTLGVGPEVPVGICLERSRQMVVGLLAILKAGGAYVPLDPNYPSERLRWMLEDAHVLLTQESLGERLPVTPARVVFLEQEATTFTQAPTNNPDIPLACENLAYVIYTSGSTGRPKGVAITHRSVSAFITWAGGVFTPEDLRAVLAATSICFDLSVFELFVPLSWGGTVVLAQNALDLPTLPSITLVNTVPSAMAELVNSGGVPPSVRTVNLAGEPLQRKLIDQIYQIPTVQHVFNLYGPSEDTTYSTFVRLERAETTVPTIGRPLANTRVYILDAHQQPVPIGIPAELHLGGDGLARGYLNRPDLTAQKFVPDPFTPDGRLYKTGDLARYRADGQIEFLGRLDFQVKIRGFRIELGEVEAALSAHPQVREGIVVAREDPLGAKSLVAYLTPLPGPGAAALRSFLQERLPEYMVPSAFVTLDHLPLTPNGKVDRKALPAPSRDRSELETRFVAPDTPVMEALTQIWQEVLQIERVGIQDNFFALGGHSLLATQVLSRARNTFQVELSLRSFFAEPTIAHLAQVIHQSQPIPQAIPRITARRDEDAVFEQLHQLCDEEIRALLEDILREEEVNP
ncbi:non-ribosomal peptide synthetase [Anthocerotibacter panamensis]|uniref:non-ribosomal peptide synthetase n=1 Tax=Anthocerotibacter panamensis TaxID=2857077 RepID=UPI001C406681|nr:non-ribosomal peptide synthetase [Anthocerotibacter panamensis]